MSDDQKFPSQLAERFQIRMPDGLRDQIRDGAAANNRSMNAEIVARLEDWPRLSSEWTRMAPALSFSNAERLRLEAELEVARAELTEVRRAADLSAAYRADLDHLTKLLRQMHEEDRAALKEVDDVTYFFEADRVRMEAQLVEEKWIPAPPDGPGDLKSTIAQRLVWVVDERMMLLSRLLPNVLKGVDKPALRRAYLAQHAAGASPLARELADIYASEAEEEASSAADFLDFVNSLIESMPDDKKPSYRHAVREIMPRLFAGWTNDDLPFAYGVDDK